MQTLEPLQATRGHSVSVGMLDRSRVGASHCRPLNLDARAAAAPANL